MKKNNIAIYYFIAFLLIVFDQVTKLAVKGFNFFGFEHEGLHYGELINVIGDTVMFTYIENPGMAFGIEFGWGKIFLSLFSIIAGIALAIFLKNIRNESPWIKTGIMLVMAGALGNMIDRVFYGVIFGEMPLFYGKVVDFIQVDIPDVDFMGLYYTHWPVFNIADSCVSVGVVILLIFHNKLPEINFSLKKKSNIELKPENE